MTKLNIQGMSCQHCVSAVHQALTEVEGVEQVVSVDLDAGSAEVKGNADTAALIAAVEEEGYTAETA